MESADIPFGDNNILYILISVSRGFPSTRLILNDRSI